MPKKSQKVTQEFLRRDKKLNVTFSFDPTVAIPEPKLVEIINHSRNKRLVTYRNSTRRKVGISVSFSPLVFPKSPQCLVSELLRDHQCYPRPFTSLRHDVEVTRPLENLGRHGDLAPPPDCVDWLRSRDVARSLWHGKNGRGEFLAG